MRNQLDILEENISLIIYGVCEDVPFELDKQELKPVPPEHRINSASAEVMALMTDYIDANFIDICKAHMDKNTCNGCTSKFICWTKR